MTASDIAVRVQGVAKSFGNTRILNDITIDFLRGSVHALVGENGAGKSSVGKIVGGYYSADEGLVEVDGDRVTRFSPRDALNRGIAMIHQELQLVPELTVLQNVFLGQETNRAGILARGDLARFRELEKTCEFGLNPSAKVATLRIAERQKVEIMRAVAREANVIIMDEPTSSLTEDEAQRLHMLISRLKAQGKTIIYVSHFLDHIIANCDRVTVMRDGHVIRTDPIAGETKQSLVDSMLGQSSEILWPELPPAPGPQVPAVAELLDVTTDTGLDGISLKVRPGEIVGLIGLVGAGRTEVGRAMFGADRMTGGTYSIDGVVQQKLSTHRAVRLGVAFVPEDRRKEGLVLTQTTRPNVSLSRLDKISSWGILKPRSERRRVQDMIDHFGIVPGKVDGDVAFYSGGNQQKVLLSKWAVERPKLLILDEPSRGVDIGARQRIHEFIVEMAASGVGVLLISSELEEVINLSHRGYLMSEGRIFAETDSRTLSVEDALNRIFQAQSARQPQETEVSA
ncbi:sugar ABC transporter ATP-binding protein [Pelagovum pacificum]|uniref:Sugar ABC transporter ATP-binding protein n=1 Tax=Pelagovum pacificum TaxID=2588711 RepID=A0A5C5GIP8_9RHOB|nr:sugar ABC transporter ATP-binding protein [Pelagovum pacificum]QQA43566.1 sugar ABC transporter ATP-binding protein [Pelagovum pacificum]TNY33296.1 sugar ABC transporter ATP-binding protein [Pelagovum pacificum]